MHENDLKNKEDLHIGGKHTVLDIFRFEQTDWRNELTDIPNNTKGTHFC